MRAYGAYRQSVLKGFQSILTQEKKHLSSDPFDLSGFGSRGRGDMFQACHVMTVYTLVGTRYRQLPHSVDGDGGPARLSASLSAKDITAGRMHVAGCAVQHGTGQSQAEQPWVITARPRREHSRDTIAADAIFLDFHTTRKSTGGAPHDRYMRRISAFIPLLSSGS